MKERFRNIPAPLQKQILQRAFGMAIGIAIMVFAGREDIVLLLPGIAALLMFLVSACSLTIRCLDENYLKIMYVRKLNSVLKVFHVGFCVGFLAGESMYSGFMTEFV